MGRPGGIAWPEEPVALFAGGTTIGNGTPGGTADGPGANANGAPGSASGQTIGGSG